MTPAVIRGVTTALALALYVLMHSVVNERAGLPPVEDWLHAAPFVVTLALLSAFAPAGRYLVRAAGYAAALAVLATFDSLVMRREGVPGLAAWAWMAPFMIGFGLILAAAPQRWFLGER